MNNLNIKPGATEEEKARAYANYFGLPFVRLKDQKIDPEVLLMIPEAVARQYHLIVYEKTSEEPATLKIAVSDPERLRKKAPEVLSQLKKEKGVNFELAIITPSDFDYAIGLYKKEKEEEREKEEREEKTEEKQLKPLIQTSGLPPINLRALKIPYKVLNKFPREVAAKYKMICFEAPEDKNSIKVALVNPEDPQAKEILHFIQERNNLEIEKYQTSEVDLNWALRLYGEKPRVELAKLPEELKEEPRPRREVKTGPLPIKALKKEKAEKEGEPVLAEKAPEIKAEEVKTEAEKEEGKEAPAIIPVGLAEQAEEKNLNTMLPRGVRHTEDLTKIIKTGFIPKIVAAIIWLAVKSEASDIHLEATTKDLRLRYRVDGILKDIVRMPLNLHPAIVSRIKILARLKIDEQRIPQDGRFEVLVDKREIDLRVSSLPTVYGEKVAMRILDKSTGIYTLEKLGLSGENLKRVKENIKKPYGIILATGPTGSGKSTTLYAILGEISTAGVNIITLEDPVEYEIEGINQCQIKPKIGFGFAEGLRSVVRQDPNIIMVGEIRDSETANLATHAALTGHLVLSTLHTNDAAGALPRLINMGVEPFLITSSINAIIAQRLIRKICPHCKKEKKLPEAIIDEVKKEIDKSHNNELAEYKDKLLKFYEGKGCSECGQDGYKGRTGLYEVLVMSEKIEDLAVRKMPASELEEQAIEEGMITMKQDGFLKALEGLTTIDEVLRVSST